MSVSTIDNDPDVSFIVHALREAYLEDMTPDSSDNEGELPINRSDSSMSLIGTSISMRTARRFRATSGYAGNGPCLCEAQQQSFGIHVLSYSISVSSMPSMRPLASRNS